jgi:hypothetical protein
VEKFRVGDESAAMSRIGRSAERRTWKIQFILERKLRVYG